MKKFNVTGLCVPEEDYMVNISEKIAQIKELVDNRCYFTINRARQYGKTTMLNELKKRLEGEYICVKTSFERLGYESFSSSKSFCFAFMRLVQKALRFTSTDDEYDEKWMNEKVTTFESLSDHITTMCKGKKIVLMIDEVDKTSNNQAFLHFLSILRDKFLERKAGTDYTFHSVILVGVYDIKNIKLKMIQEGTYMPSASENKIYNSPWNIAADFDIDMSFKPNEIASMLKSYESEHHTDMCVESISKEIYNYTSGYPFLVSRICQHIDIKLNKAWSIEGIRNAVQILIGEKNTLFDDISKNLGNNKELSDFIYELLILGESKPYVIHDSIISTGVQYGLFRKAEGNGKVAVSNKIFEALMTDYFISKDLRKARRIINILQHDVIYEGRFDMELCLRKFAEHYAEIFSESDVVFLERHGRLLFLSYLKPLINGQGFYHIESQFTDLRRMDVVVDFGSQQFIVELKLWRGKQYQSEAYEQLCAYLDSKHTDEGYLLTFDFRKRDKIRRAEWININGKKIFEVMV